MRQYFLRCKISLLIVIRVNTCTPWSIIPFFPNPHCAASPFLWSLGRKENPLHRKASHCLTIWSILKEFDIFMKMYFSLYVESGDHLHMCLSEIAQARQVSPVREIKLAAMFIDLGVWMPLGILFSVEHQVILDGFPLICHPSCVRMTGQQQSHPTSSWPPGCDAQNCEVFEEKKQTAQAFLQEFAPWRNGPRSCFLITLGRSWIPCEMLQH